MESRVSHDDSNVCALWSERKLAEEIDAQLVRAYAAQSPGAKLGFLGGTRALIGVLADRAKVAARAAERG